MSRKEYDAISKHLEEVKKPETAAMYTMAVKAALLDAEKHPAVETIRGEYRYIFTPVRRKKDNTILSAELFPGRGGFCFNILGTMEVIHRKTDQSTIVFACIEFLYTTGIVFWVNEKGRVTADDISDLYTAVLSELCPELRIMVPEGTADGSGPDNEAESMDRQLRSYAGRLLQYKEGDPELEEVYSSAMDLGQQILTAYPDYPYRSGVYTTMAFTAFNKFIAGTSTSAAHEELLLVKEYAEKAMAEDQRNQRAIAIGVVANLFTMNIREATEMVPRLTGSGFTEVSRDTNFLSLFRFSFHLRGQDNMESVRRDVYDYLTALCEKASFEKYLLGSYAFLCIQLIYIDYGDVHTAYSFVDRYARNLDPSPAFFDLYALCCMICQDPRIKKVEEAVQYGKLGLKYVNDQNEKSKANLYSTYGLALAKTGDRNGISFCRQAVQIIPGDTTYFNYGRCLLLTGKAKLGIQWAQKALFLNEDEMNFLLLADLYRAAGQDDSALEYYIKAFHCAQRHYALNQFTDENGKQTLSVVSDALLLDCLHEIFLNTIPIYIKRQDYKNALVHLELADELAPDYPEWAVYKQTLPVIEYSQKELREARSELLIAREEAQKQAAMSRELAEQLIRLQDQFGHANMDNDKNWRRFSAEIDAIIAKLEEEACRDKKRMESMQEKFAALFNNYSPEAIHFLTTAEVLYEMHRNNEIDFACIVVEYCKVLEHQLRKVLGDQIPEEAKMLGKIIGLIRDTKDSPYRKCLGLMNEVNELRKQSAHTGSLTKQEAERIRTIYFNEGLLDLLN